MLQQATVEIIPKDATVEFPPDPFYTISAKINTGVEASFNTLCIPNQIAVVYATGAKIGCGVCGDEDGGFWMNYFPPEGPTGLHTDTIQACFTPPQLPARYLCRRYDNVG